MRQRPGREEPRRQSSPARGRRAGAVVLVPRIKSDLVLPAATEEDEQPEDETD